MPGGGVAGVRSCRRHVDGRETVTFGLAIPSLRHSFFTHPTLLCLAYADLLQPPSSVADVTYWLNYLSAQRKSGTRYSAINTAVEATTLNERCFKLRPQDRFIRDNLERDDVLIVSIGGNDIAMAPSPCTVASVAGLLCLPQSCLQNGRSFGAVPFNDCCCGFGASLASCGCSCPPCLGYCESANVEKGRPSNTDTQISWHL